MTRQLLLVPLLLAAAVVTGCQKSDAEVVASARAEMIEGCKGGAGAAPGITPAQVDQLCECTADGIVAAYTPAQIREMDKLEEPTPEIAAKAQEVTMECAIKVMTPAQ
jgi:hypothetical protein